MSLGSPCYFYPYYIIAVIRNEGHYYHLVESSTEGDRSIYKICESCTQPLMLKHFGFITLTTL